MSLEPATKARILVVDDSKLMRKAALKMLGDEFDVVTAEDGVDAWDQLATDDSIQVVFTDLNMPRSDGYDLLRKVRAAENRDVQALPVIVVTGAENDESARMQALDMGATDFITKPFTTTDLVARARAHANNQRITRQLQAQTTIDVLTGLSNQAGFLARLQQDIAYARRHQQVLSVVRMEIEDFRRLFLYHGRELAESLLVQVATLTRARIRKEDTAARIGLGGFALTLPGGEAIGIEGMIARLREELVAHPVLDEDGRPILVALRAAVLSPDMEPDTNAQSVFEQCQRLLEAAPESAVAVAQSASPAVAPAAVPDAAAAAVEETEVAAVVAAPEPPAAPVSVPRPEPEPAALPPAPAPAAPAVVPTPAVATAKPAAAPVRAAGAAEPLRIDPLLDQMAKGNAQAVAEKLPQIIGRLLPVLRLLGPNQRAQLIQFLQRLG